MPLHPPVSGTNRSDVKAHNLSAVLLSLLHHNDVSRVHLAQMLGVSNATITNLVNELTQQGLVHEQGFVENSGQVGRRQRALHLLPDARYAIGVHVDVGTVYVALTDMRGQIVERRHFQHALDAAPEQVLRQTIEIIHELQGAHTQACQRLVGVGVAASGLVDWTTGVNVVAPNLGWRDVPIQQMLTAALPYPVRVENNVRAMALGEALFGNATQANAMAFIYGRVGVGAGLVVGGQLYRGANAGAGEIGHMLLATQGDEPQPLEALISAPAMLRQARDAGHATATYEAMLDAVRQGAAPHHAALLNQQAFYLGLAIANLVNLLNPELIVLGGIFQQAADVLLLRVHETVQRYAFANLGARLTIRTTQLGAQVGVIGAAALALDAFLYRANQ